MTEHRAKSLSRMGPGGEDVAGKLAEAGLDVVGIEKQLVGGNALLGCVPSKMMIRPQTQSRRGSPHPATGRYQ